MKSTKILLWSAVALAVIAVLALAAGPLYNFLTTGSFIPYAYGMGGRMGGAGRMFTDHSLPAGLGTFGSLVPGLGGLVAAAAAIGALILGGVLLFKVAGKPATPETGKTCAHCGETLQEEWVYCSYCGERV